MSKTRWHQKSSPRAILLLLACLFTLHCEETEQIIVDGSGPYNLRFSLAGDFQQYGGERISWALLRSDTGERLVTGAGTISFTANPPFTANTGNVMLLGVPHEMHYWIDTNIGGGTPGECDPVVRDADDNLVESFDRQWTAPFGGATADLVFIAIHNPDRVQDVCASFPF